MNIILPQRKSGAAHKPWPLLILLHDAGGDFTSWLRNSSAARYAEEAGIALAMPDGLQSWYTDMKYGSFFRRFIGEEIPARCREFCPGITEAGTDTWVAGCGMGGYGALAAALTYPETFAGAACFSAPFDPMKALAPDAEGNWYRSDRFGTPEEFSGSVNDLYSLSEKRAGEGRALPAVTMACGCREDVLPEQRKMAKHLSALGYPVTASEEDDSGWDLWDREIRRVMKTITRL